MKVPSRPAPSVPPSKSSQNRLETDDWPPDPFSPPRLKQDKKKAPPPRPPPPRLNTNQGSNHFRSIFGSTKRSGKKGSTVTAIVKPLPIAPAPPIPTGTLIDLQTPPSSPKSQRNQASLWSLSSSSVCESGFEDDFGSLLSSAATTPSGLSGANTPSADLISPVDPPLKTSRPTIICVPNKKKPSRPPPPQLSPPMPTVPPPPPPPHLLQVLTQGPPLPPRPSSPYQPQENSGLPTCTAMYDYESTHPDDLQFKTGDVILLLGKEGDEWCRGQLRGQEGIFPASYVSINKTEARKKPMMTAIALFTYNPMTWDDLELQEGETVQVLDRVDSNWLYGESMGKRGIFPESYIQDISAFSDND